MMTMADAVFLLCAVTSLASRSSTNRPASVGFRYRLG